MWVTQFNKIVISNNFWRIENECYFGFSDNIFGHNTQYSHIQHEYTYRYFIEILINIILDVTVHSK